MNRTVSEKSAQNLEAPLVQDIKPIPIKQRSSLGAVELTLSDGHKIKAVGVVYGLEHTISGNGYQARIFLDHYSQRINILEYDADNYEALILQVRALAEANGFDKIICMAARSDWQRFLRHGYVLEAVLKYYRKGEDSFVVSKFRSQERIMSPSLMEEILLIENIMGKQGPVEKREREVPEGFLFRLAEKKDIPELIGLYQSIFETYRSNFMIIYGTTIHRANEKLDDLHEAAIAMKASSFRSLIFRS